MVSEIMTSAQHTVQAMLIVLAVLTLVFFGVNVYYTMQKRLRRRRKK